MYSGIREENIRILEIKIKIRRYSRAANSRLNIFGKQAEARYINNAAVLFRILFFYFLNTIFSTIFNNFLVACQHEMEQMQFSFYVLNDVYK